MTAFAVDRGRRAATYAVLFALGVVYAGSLAIFVRTDRRPPVVSRRDVGPPVPIALSVPMRIGGCGECRRSGWSAPEADWTWTTKETATVVVSRPAIPELHGREFVVVFEFDAGAFVIRDMRRTLRVSINGEAVGEVQFRASDPVNSAFFAGGHFVHSFQVPERLVTAAPTLLIELHMALIGSPRTYYLTTDRRQVGVAVRSVTLKIAE
jgi:hypothetical protein